MSVNICLWIFFFFNPFPFCSPWVTSCSAASNVVPPQLCTGALMFVPVSQSDLAGGTGPTEQFRCSALIPNPCTLFFSSTSPHSGGCCNYGLKLFNAFFFFSLLFWFVYFFSLSFVLFGFVCLFPSETIYCLHNPSPQQIPTNQAGIQESPRQWDVAFPEAWGTRLQPCLHVLHTGHTNPQCSCGYFCLQSMSGS